MTRLADQIEALRVKMLDEHGEAMRLLDGLDKRLFANDADIMRRLESILSEGERRKGDIVRAMQTLAARIGCLPPPAQSPVQRVEGGAVAAQTRKAA